MNSRMDAAPSVTVLMPVYNGAAFLSEALESMFCQSLQDFELLVIDDGSTDATATILAACSDSRLRVVRNQLNLGLVATLNKGLDIARGELVARMDADDVALPARLESQMQFLSRHPEIGICGTWFRELRDGKATLVRPPCTHDDLSAHLFFYSPFAHPSVMLRKGPDARPPRIALRPGRQRRRRPSISGSGAGAAPGLRTCRSRCSTIAFMIRR